MNITLLKESKDILAVMLFGSTARKDEDVYSDKDIFVLCNNLTPNEFLEIKHRLILPSAGETSSVCSYRHKDVLLMAQKGSLFMWHLKLQGVIIFSKNNVIENIFTILKPYENYREGLKSCRELLDDIKESFRKWGDLTEFDLALLFTIARNICIFLCYQCGEPKFGRSDAYLTIREIFLEKFPMPDWLYTKLCSCKLWYERGIKIETKLCDKTPDCIIIHHIKRLLEFAERQCL